MILVVERDFFRALWRHVHVRVSDVVGHSVVNSLGWVHLDHAFLHVDVGRQTEVVLAVAVPVLCASALIVVADY